MKKFLKNNKLLVIIGVLIVILILFIVWFFIVPSFNGNKYGNRLKEESKHKISSETIDKIKDKADDNESVDKIEYHKEGRILNFTVYVSSSFTPDQAKEFGSSLVGEIDEDDRKYYDIQILIDSDEKSDNYPIIGYKSKNEDKINYGNVGG
ncbi:MAG: hypothetical protein IKF01_00730 [Bacilli bacterium]|nr:hypothetical protein [Bacilli bacterium]